jgi:ABC-type Na+ efflux pump permease subunit
MPFSSGFALPVKIMYGLTNPTELVISTAILLLTIVVIYLVGQRIFSSNIIKYSFKKKKKLKENKSNSK